MPRIRDLVAGSFNGIASAATANTLIERSDELRAAETPNGETGCSTPAFVSAGSLLVAGSVYLGAKISKEKGPLASVAIGVATLAIGAAYGHRVDKKLARLQALRDARHGRPHDDHRW